jgi:hypothetical protein
MRGVLRNAISTFFPRALSNDAAMAKRPLSPTKSVGEKALDGKMLPRNLNKGQKHALVPSPSANPQ